MRLKIILTFFVVSLVAVVSVTAQTGCGDDLSIEDCQIVLDSEQVMSEVDSATFTLDAELRVDNLDNEMQVITMYSNGAYAFNDTGSENVLAPIFNFTGDISFLFDFSETDTELADDSPFSFDLRWMDAVGYINLAKLAVPDAEADWYGIDFGGELIDQLAPLTDLEATEAATDSLMLVPFTVSRVEAPSDEVAVFRWSADFDNALRSPMGRIFIEVVIGAALQGIFTDAEIEAILDDYLLFLGDMTLDIERTIDLNTLVVTEINVDYTFTPSDSTLATVAGGLDPLDLGELDIAVDFHLTLAQHNLNETMVIPQPDDPILVPLDDVGSL